VARSVIDPPRASARRAEVGKRVPAEGVRIG
jgi:hypothetical protein